MLKILNDKKYIFNTVNSGHIVFQGKRKLLKNPVNDKKYFNRPTVKNFRANSVFQGKRRLFKILNDKKYIFNTVNSGHIVFQGKSKLLKNPVNGKNIFNTAGATNSSFWGGNFHELSFDDVIVLIQPWYIFFANGHKVLFATFLKMKSY